MAAPRLSLVEQAYQEIRRRILDNEYPQGHQVLEHELASELGMSRTPIREALVRLQTDKFVQIVPRHGMRVIPLESNDLQDMYEVLTALEATAIERLARSNPASSAFVSLEQALDSMDRAVARGDHDGWVRADERFHRGLVELCGNTRLKALADALWDQGHRARTTSVRLRQNLETSNAEHRAVVDAIRRGDWREAKTLHVKHRARTSTEIIGLLQKFRLARVYLRWNLQPLLHVAPRDRREDRQTPAHGRGNLPWGTGDTPLREILQVVKKNTGRCRSASNWSTTCLPLRRREGSGEVPAVLQGRVGVI